MLKGHTSVIVIVRLRRL